MSAVVTRRALAGGLAASAIRTAGGAAASRVNAPRVWPVRQAPQALQCVVDAGQDLGPVDRRIFGTNLEWFNEAGGLDSPDPAMRARLLELARAQHISVFRFPGGILADYYDWSDGTGPRAQRPVRTHPTDPGRSANGFGSPEFFGLLRQTGAEGLITVNVGTSTAAAAAAWVAYANQPGNTRRLADGQAAPAGIRLWEVGNEVYLPGNPGERKITQTPQAYAAHFLEFATAMRAVDPNIEVIAIGVASAQSRPDTPYPDWSEKLLAAAADRIDMLAVHNAYFPLLYDVRQPAIEQIYPALWAAPEAVDRSLTKLETLLDRFAANDRLGIALTEWGALFSVPDVDPYWFDHVKTIGTAVYVARMLQVLISHPRVRLANYFKFADRSFMGWVAYDGTPKVPYWMFELYARATGTRRIAASLDSPTYDARAVGAMLPQSNVPEVTVVATRSPADGRMFINFVNRSLTTAHRIRLRLQQDPPATLGEIRSISAAEPTAHNGADIPPEMPMRPEYDPYTTAPPGSISIASRPWSADDPIALPPFSAATLVLG